MRKKNSKKPKWLGKIWAHSNKKIEPRRIKYDKHYFFKSFDFSELFFNTASIFSYGKHSLLLSYFVKCMQLFFTSQMKRILLFFKNLSLNKIFLGRFTLTSKITLKQKIEPLIRGFQTHPILVGRLTLPCVLTTSPIGT